MSRRKMILCSSMAVATLLAAKSITAPADAGAAERAADRPVITRIVGRDLRVTITASPNGPRYSVTNADGHLFASDLTLAQLRAQHPALHQRIEPAISDSSAANAWAGIETD